MAKLNVLVPAVDVEVIGADGVKTKYRKVERDVKEGDIIKITDNEGSDYVVEGAFYEVEYLDGSDDPQILDEDGDEYDAGSLEYEVYEKVAESPVPASDEITFEGDKYRKVNRDARKGDVIKITEPDDEDDAVTVGGIYRIESVDWNGDPQITDNGGDEFDTYGSLFEVYEKVAIQYREVKRPAKIGERIKIVDAQMANKTYQNGDVFVAIKVEPSGGVHLETNGRSIVSYVFQSEYVVLEPIAEKPQPKRLTVGDYAKVVTRRGNHNYAVDSVVKIVVDDETNSPYIAEKPDGSRGNWLQAENLTPATEAEFLAQKTALAPSFKVGDFVKVVDASGATSAKDGDVGEIITIEPAFGDGQLFRTKTLDGREYGMFERRFTRATESEVAAAKEALKFGDFEDGDFAQIVNATRDNATLDARNNADKFVTVTREVGPYKRFGLRLLSDGKFAGYANASALRKVTKEEYETATDPRNQFAKGDVVRVVKTGTHFAATGQILRVYDSVDYGPNCIRCEHLNGKREGCDYFYALELEKLSAEEAKWAAIGRKVNDFKPGDLVQIIANTTASVNNVGDYGTVAKGPGPKTGRYQVDAGKGTSFTWTEPMDMKLIAPVEQRFDRTEDAA